MRVAVALFIIFGIVSANMARAASCGDVFTGAAASHGGGDGIEFESGAKLINTGTSIDIPIKDNTSGSCDSGSCSYSGSTAEDLSLSSFLTTSSSYKLEVSKNDSDTWAQGNAEELKVLQGGELEITQNNQVSRIKTLIVEKNGDLILADGVYWIETLEMGQNSKLIINSGERVTIYVDTATFGPNGSTDINNSGSTDQLTVIAYDKIEVLKNAKTKGYFYASTEIKFVQGADHVGGIHSPYIKLEKNATVTFDDSGLSTAKFDDTCTSGSTPDPDPDPDPDPPSSNPGTSKIAHYTFDESGDSSSSVTDITGNGYDGDFDSELAIFDPTSDIDCKALSSDDNTSRSTRNYFDTNLDMNTVGGQGGISFWFRSNTVWNDNDDDRMLFDASRDSDGENEFYLTKLKDGKLSFGFEDEDNEDYRVTTNALTHAADEWVHIGVSWDLPNDTYAIYVNGSAQTLNVDRDEGITGDNFASIPSLVFGDNRDEDANNGDIVGNAANGDFDDIRIYNSTPPQSQFQWDEQDVGSCSTPDPDPDPDPDPPSSDPGTSKLAHYTFDESGDSGSSVADITGNGNSGDFPSQLSIFLPTSDVACNAISSDNNTDTDDRYAFDTNVDANTIGEQGGIGFWYRSNTVWNDGTDRTLFDASDAWWFGISGVNQFYLTKNGDGSLSFGFEDNDHADLLGKSTTFTFAAEEWVHIGVSWDLPNDSYLLYINGQLSSWSSLTNDTTSDSFRTLHSVVFGDNRDWFIEVDMTGNAANGDFDDIRIYDAVPPLAQFEFDHSDVTACSAPETATIDHYLIEHPDTALTCRDPAVTIKACANEACDELHDEELTVSLTPSASWSASSATFTGSTTVALNHRSVGSLTLGLTDLDPSADVECSGDCSVTYTDAGFEIYHVSTNSTNFSSNPYIAESALSDLGLRAVYSNGEECSALVSGSHSVNVSYECVRSGGVDYTPNACNVPFAGISLSGGSTHSGSISLNFNADGEANFGSYEYADVGELDLTVTATVNGASVESSTERVEFIPSSIYITGDTTNLHAAGDEFDIQVTAIGADGGVLPGYRPSVLQASVQRDAPASGSANDGYFYLESGVSRQTSSAESFSSITEPTFGSSGYSTTSAYLEEIGEYTFKLRDNDFLGNQINSNSFDIGRLIPAYFEVEMVATAEFAHSCSSSFTYIGQSFYFDSGAEPNFRVTAKNAKGGTVENYASTDWRLLPNGSDVTSDFSYSDDTGYSGSLNIVSKGDAPVFSNTSSFDGVGYILVSNAELKYSKEASLSTAASPFATRVDLLVDADFFTDSDGVCYQSSYPGSCDDYLVADIQGTEQRYGRLMLENAYGPETSSLRVPIVAEYLNGGNWHRSATDSCTSIALSQSGGDVSLVHDVESDINLATEISSLSADGTLAAGLSDSSDLTIAPVEISGENKQGSFYLQLVPQTDAGHWSRYLNIDWDGDGIIEDDEDMPTAAIKFGLYRGNDKTLHWREVFE